MLSYQLQCIFNITESHHAPHQVGTRPQPPLTDADKWSPDGDWALLGIQRGCRRPSPVTRVMVTWWAPVLPSSTATVTMTPLSTLRDIQLTVAVCLQRFYLTHLQTQDPILR